MKTQKTTIFVCLFSIVSLIAPSILADPQTWGKFCAKWQAQYTDSYPTSGHEDIFFGPFSIYRPGNHTLAQVAKVVGFAQVKVWPTGSDWAPLDNTGCTPNLLLEEDNTYKIIIKTVVQDDDGNKICLQDKNATSWTCDSPTGYESYSQSFYLGESGSHTCTLYVSEDEYSHVMPILGRIIQLVNSGDIPWYSANEDYEYDTLYIRDVVGEGYQYDHNGRIAINYNADSNRKFLIAHEIGHAFGDMGSKLLRGYSDYDVDQGSGIPDLCNCNFLDTDTTDTDYVAHCLQSRENIRIGESEGFGHFFSSAVFNSRQTNGWFGYYKKVKYSPLTGCTAPPCWVDVTDHELWMEEHCEKDDRGVEWDWLTFFWGLWTEDSQYKYDMEEIHDVWEQVHEEDTETGTNYEDWLWDTVCQAADTLYDGYKYLEFVTQGENAGVDH